VLGEADKSSEAFAKADAIAPLESRRLSDRTRCQVRRIAPGAAPPPEAVALLERNNPHCDAVHKRQGS
jgi:cytochrome c-type biogenesis protein CcmH